MIKKPYAALLTLFLTSCVQSVSPPQEDSFLGMEVPVESIDPQGSPQLELAYSLLAQMEAAPADENSTVEQLPVKIIFYRLADPQEKGAAHVYVDGEFHTALRKNSATIFCLRPGKHALGAYLNDAPSYLGKESPEYYLQFKPGKTYYFRVDPLVNGLPLSRTLKQAASDGAIELPAPGLLSRASKVERC